MLSSETQGEDAGSLVPSDDCFLAPAKTAGVDCLCVPARRRPGESSGPSVSAAGSGDLFGLCCAATG